MRLGSFSLSATLSAVLLSGCSFFDNQFAQTKNPYANQQAGQYGQGFVNQHCQIATPRHPIPRGCRPEQVTLGVPAQAQAFGAPAYGGQSYGTTGFPQQPQFGQPQFATGGYGAALGRTAAVAHQTGPKKRKPRLRGSFSVGIERSLSGDIFDPSIRDDLSPAADYNPQDFANDSVDSLDGPSISDDIRRPGGFESANFPAIPFEEVWATPLSIKGGLEYIVNDRTTVFVNAGHTYAAGDELDAATVNATVYQEVSNQPFAPVLDATGAAVGFAESGDPEVNVTFIPNQQIASFAYDFSNLRQYDLEIGARQYFNPIVKSDGFKTVTPFVGASVGVAYVNAVDFTVAQRQTSFESIFEGEATTFDVPSDGTSTRLYDSDWLPQAQLNVGAEWQLTPGFALAAETGVKFQGARDYSDFVNAAGETIEGQNGDLNISIPLTLRGSVNF